MVDTVRTLSALQTLLADNTDGDIGAQDVRDFLVSVYPVVIGKSADESVSSSTTPQADDDLLVPIGANERWVVRWTLFPSCTDQTVDLKLLVTIPSGAAGWWFVEGKDNAATANNSPEKMQSFTIDGSTALSLGVAASGSVNWPAFVQASVTNGATPGNITLNWAQNSSSATAMTLLEESYLIAHQVNS